VETLVSQARAFFVTIAIGVAAGLCYDYYRMLRGVLRLKKTGTCLGDIVFWLVTTVIVFLMLLRGNWGEMRLYVLIGLGLGALIYFYLFSSRARSLFKLKFFVLYKTWGFFVKAVLVLREVIIFPFRLGALILSYPLLLIRYILYKTGSFLKPVFYRVAGRRLENAAASFRQKLTSLAFWKRNKGS